MSVARFVLAVLVAGLAICLYAWGINRVERKMIQEVIDRREGKR